MNLMNIILVFRVLIVHVCCVNKTPPERRKLLNHVMLSNLNRLPDDATSSDVNIMASQQSPHLDNRAFGCHTDQHIVRLQVSVGDTQAMQEGHGTAELLHHTEVTLGIRWTGEQVLIQVSPIAVLHDEPQGQAAQGLRLLFLPLGRSLPGSVLRPLWGCRCIWLLLVLELGPSRDCVGPVLKSGDRVNTPLGARLWVVPLLTLLCSDYTALQHTLDQR